MGVNVKLRKKTGMPHLKMPFRLTALFFLLAIINQPTQADQQQITWLIIDSPPIYILNEHKAPTSVNDLGSGTGDRGLREIIDRLPNYQHKFILANPLRVWAEFSAEKNVCTVPSNKTSQREKYAYFAPVGLTNSVGIVVRKDRMDKLQLNFSSTSLIQLISGRTDLRGYVASGRSFGESVDNLLSTNGSNLIRQVVPADGNMLQMLDRNRMDYTIEYPQILEYYNRKHLFYHEMQFIPIDEAPQSIKVYVACTRNKWGEQVINDVARAIQDAAGTSAFRQATLDWMPPDLVTRDKKKFEKFFDDLVKEIDVIK
jgi:uncharacterized protein (TIGR02285 family)